MVERSSVTGDRAKPERLTDVYGTNRGFFVEGFFVDLMSSICDDMLGPVRARVNDEAQCIDPYSDYSTLDPSFAGKWTLWLHHFVGTAISDILSDTQRRALVASTVALYARRGTRQALMERLQLCLGLRSDQIEITRPSMDTKILSIRISAFIEPEKVAFLSGIIEFEMPAHLVDKYTLTLWR